MSFNVKIDVQAPDFKKIVQPGIRLFDELNRSIQETQNSVKTLMKDYETKTFHSFMNMHCLGGGCKWTGRQFFVHFISKAVLQRPRI